VSESDPFGPCAHCFHARRCHDSRGCGKWVEAQVIYIYETSLCGSYGVKTPVISPAHTCPCAGFEESRP
jgi:hypothetical protein